MTTPPPNGVFAAVLTPLNDDGAPEPVMLAHHCQTLLARGCDGLSVLGTTGEANSFSVEERLTLLNNLAEAGLSTFLMPGTGCCAIPDTVRLTQAALEAGAPYVLMLPPFYYKGVSDDGLFAAYSEVIERVADPKLQIVLYHFPALSGVPITHALIERLIDAYPGTVVGIKDSSGDLDAMIATVRAFPGFAVLSGSDDALWPLMQAGGAGCITAVCNVASALAADVVRAWRAGDITAGDAAHRHLSAIRGVFTRYPLAAALKAMLARTTGDDGWHRIRPPLMPLTSSAATALSQALSAFPMPVPGPPTTNDHS